MLKRMRGRLRRTTLLGYVAGFVLPAFAADLAPAARGGIDQSTMKSASQSEILELKSQLLEQRRMIEQLRLELEEQRKLIGLATAGPADVPTGRQARSSGEVASTAPVVPARTLPLAKSTQATVAAAQKGDAEQAPLQLHIGSATLTPVGFMDFTGVYRSTNPGTGIGTNFGSVPYKNTVQGNLGEFRLSAQNSRVGFRVDAKVRGANVLGYLESDFLGFVPGNAAVTSNSDNLRMRLYWVDVRKDKIELFGGQSWSMLTPNRKGLSALPSDLFYTQDIDVNYQAGLVWSRNPQFRFILHPSAKVAMGVSLEGPEQYIGGSGGGGLVTLPSALSTPYATQLNNGNTALSVPDVHPDVIAKVAFDPSRRAHFEVAGLFRTFKVYNPLNQNHFSAHGGGASVNFGFELAKNFRFFSNNFYSDGGGRWIFGLAPDLIVRADGSLSPIHSGSTLDGFELQHGNTQFYAYYGGVYIARNTALDTTGNKLALVGYGFSGSSGAQNRVIHEPTFGITQTFWKDPKYGALQLMLQYSYVLRHPWFVATEAPKDGHSNMAFVNLRYLLPGSAPHIE